MTSYYNGKFGLKKSEFFIGVELPCVITSQVYGLHVSFYLYPGLSSKLQKRVF